MQIIRWELHPGAVGFEISGEIEVEDDATDEEIEEKVQETIWEHVEWYWEKKEIA